MDIKITEKQREKIIDLLANKKTTDVIKLFGGTRNILKLFNNDLKEFYKVTGYSPYKFDSISMNMYIDNLLLESLNLEDSWDKKEKELGDFRWTSGGMNYKFTAHASSPFISHRGQELRRVVGTCGDHGFGYYFITKRNTIGKRGRKQIFKQIIEKYNLDSYL